jgi:hypothetical protein
MAGGKLEARLAVFSPHDDAEESVEMGRCSCFTVDVLAGAASVLHYFMQMVGMKGCL